MTLQTIDPASGKEMRAYPHLSSEAVADRIGRAHAAQSHWRRSGMEERAAGIPLSTLLQLLDNDVEGFLPRDPLELRIHAQPLFGVRTLEGVVHPVGVVEQVR